MKTFFTGFVVAVLLAVAGGFALNSVGRSTADHYATPYVRL